MTAGGFSPGPAVVAANIARAYVRNGVAVIPVPYRSKAPTHEHWEDLRLAHQDVAVAFRDPVNIGGLLGCASGGLTDIDLDCPEAIELADALLPPTGSIFGRKSKRRSHRLYRCESAPRTTRFQHRADGRSTTIVEFRSDGAQTILPGSVHPTGEAIEWDEEGEPAGVDGDDLYRQVEHLAAGALLVRLWPSGARHDAVLALGGALLRSGWPVELTSHFVGAVARAAGDEEVDDRVRAVATTAGRLQRGEEVTGWPTAAEIFGASVIRKVRKWLGGPDGFEPDRIAIEDGETPPPAAPFGGTPPTPLPNARQLPSFPTSALPAWLREFVESEADATQTPVDMAALFTLGAVATVAGGHVEVKAVPGWREGVNVYAVAAMEPGSRKSAVKRDTEAPLVAYEQQLADAVRPDVAEQASRRRIAEAALARAEKAAANAKPELRPSLEAAALAAARALENLPVAVMPRLVTADATPEALASLLHAHDGRMSVLSAEGGIFDLMAGRYSNGVPNLDVFLCGHAGDPIRVDRRGRSPEFVDRPALTICLAVQPYVLRRAGKNAELEGRGLLDRFLYSIPPGNVGYRRTDAPSVPTAVTERYASGLIALAGSLRALVEPAVLTLSTEAAAILRAWRTELEPRRRPDADLGHIQGWASKLDGATVRIAGLLHLAEHRDAPQGSRSVAGTTMSGAVTIGRYLIEHALAAFGQMGAEGPIDDARRVQRWIVSGQRRSFSRRECHRAHETRFHRSEDLDPVLELLEEHRWIRRAADEHRPGRPTERYEVNPHIYSTEPTEPTEPERGVSSVRSVAETGHHSLRTKWALSARDARTQIAD